MTTRFAPSPTGLLHLGHACSAWFAREAGERCLLRIDDLDASRCRAEYEEALLEDLTWLGLGFEGELMRQSERHAHYQKALDWLTAEELVYPCCCTRREAAELAQMSSAPHGPDGPIYPGTCRQLDAAGRAQAQSAGREPAWRLDTQEAIRRAGALTFVESGIEVECRAEVFGDVILGRRDAGFSYHLCVVLDDAAQGVDLVTRGNDLAPSAHLHRLLQQILGLPVPEWRHHGLICDENGKRLAKRHDALSIRAMREAGLTPADVRRIAVPA